MNLLNAFHLLNAITEGGADYQKEYLEYINSHKERVEEFSKWLLSNCPDLFENVDIDVFNDLIKEHDESKFSEEEFEPYAQHFYGSGDNDFEFDKAWEHHWQNNEHHPEYWGGEAVPYIYILEMICDWGSFGIQKGDYKELIDYYYTKAIDDEEKNLSDNTKKIIEEILSKIEEVD